MMVTKSEPIQAGQVGFTGKQLRNKKGQASNIFRSNGNRYELSSYARNGPVTRQVMPETWQDLAYFSHPRFEQHSLN